MECDPAAKVEVVNVALPLLFSVALPIGPEPLPKVSTKKTIPVGVPAPGLVAVTIAVSVTDSPLTDGFCEEVTVVVDAKKTTVKLVALVAVPSGVVTAMASVVAPVGTVAVMEVSETTAKLAGTPLNLTAVAPVKFVPVIVTTVPTGPLAGVKEVMAGVTVKRVVVIKGPLLGVMTVMGPVVAPAGTVAVMEVSETTVKLAASPLNLTAVAPVKFVPVIVTTVPTGPKIGVNGLKLSPSRKAWMSSNMVGPTWKIPPIATPAGELLKADES